MNSISKHSWSGTVKRVPHRDPMWNVNAPKAMTDVMNPKSNPQILQ